MDYIRDFIVETEFSASAVEQAHNRVLVAYLRDEIGRDQVAALRAAIYAALSLHNKRVFCDTQLHYGEIATPAYGGFINPLDELDRLHQFLEERNLL